MSLLFVIGKTAPEKNQGLTLLSSQQQMLEWEWNIFSCYSNRTLASHLAIHLLGILCFMLLLSGKSHVGQYNRENQIIAHFEMLPPWGAQLVQYTAQNTHIPSHGKFGVWLAFWLQFSTIADSERPHTIFQIIGSLPLSQETRTDFQGPDCSLNQPWLTWAFEKQTNRSESISLFSSLHLLISPSLSFLMCVSLPLGQIKIS